MTEDWEWYCADAAAIKSRLNPVETGPKIIFLNARDATPEIAATVCSWMATNCFGLTDRNRATWFLSAAHRDTAERAFRDHCQSDLTVGDEVADLAMTIAQQSLILVGPDAELYSGFSSLIGSIRTALRNELLTSCRGSIITACVTTPHTLLLSALTDASYLITHDMKIVEMMPMTPSLTYDHLLTAIMNKTT